MNAGLYSHLMQTLSDEKTELELKLTGCSNQVSQDLQRELWIVVGVSKFGLQSDLRLRVALQKLEEYQKATQKQIE